MNDIKSFFFTDATATCGINYWFEWPQQKGRFMSDEGDVGMKIRFLEAHLKEAANNWSYPNILTDHSERFLKKNVTDYSLGNRMMTRQKKASINHHKFNDAEVSIARNTPYEACLISKRGKVTRRRTYNGEDQPRPILRNRAKSAGARSMVRIVSSKYDE